MHAIDVVLSRLFARVETFAMTSIDLIQALFRFQFTFIVMSPLELQNVPHKELSQSNHVVIIVTAVQLLIMLRLKFTVIFTCQPAIFRTPINTYSANYLVACN